MRALSTTGMVVAAVNTVGVRPGAVSCGASSVWAADGSVPGRAGAGEELLVVTVERETGPVLRARDRETGARARGAAPVTVAGAGRRCARRSPADVVTGRTGGR